MEKVLYLKLFQIFAHYREPKVLQDDYIPTLELPSMTTVVGMLSYILGEKFENEIDLSVVGTHKRKEIHFIRGENGEFWNDYRTLIKNKKEIENLREGRFYNFYKEKKIKNRIMRYELLRDVSLEVFIKAEINVLKKLKEKLENNNRYLALGRKEDFALLGFIENGRIKKFEPIIVDIEKISISSVRDSISKELKLENTYISVDIRNNENEKLLNSGILYTLPYTYEDLKAEKEFRRLKYKHYIYLDEEYYPNNGTINKYKNKCFVWMGGEEI